MDLADLSSRNVDWTSPNGIETKTHVDWTIKNGHEWTNRIWEIFDLYDLSDSLHFLFTEVHHLMSPQGSCLSGSQEWPWHRIPTQPGGQFDMICLSKRCWVAAGGGWLLKPASRGQKGWNLGDLFSFSAVFTVTFFYGKGKWLNVSCSSAPSVQWCLAGLLLLLDLNDGEEPIWPNGDSQQAGTVGTPKVKIWISNIIFYSFYSQSWIQSSIWYSVYLLPSLVAIFRSSCYPLWCPISVCFQGDTPSVGWLRLLFRLMNLRKQLEETMVSIQM